MEIEQRYGDWVQLASGGKFYIFDPRPEEIFIEDIAHSLSNLCRFTGHAKKYYSVAQHSVLVSYCCNPDDALWALVHDASEYVTNDMNRPMKYAPEMKCFREAEENIMRCVCVRFGLPLEMPPSVKLADNRVLLAEARDLMPQPLNWDLKWTQGIVPQESPIIPLSPKKAKKLFLKRWKELYCGN